MKKLFVLLFCSASFAAHSQNNSTEIYDTASRTEPLFCHSDELHRNFKFSGRPDSVMHNIQVYDKLKRKQPFIQNLGDIGTAFRRMDFNPLTPSGFITGFNTFPGMGFNANNALFYNTRQPFSFFEYAQGNAGKRGLINFNALHTQNIGRRFNVAARYSSTSYDGFFLNQTISNKMLQVSSYYHSLNNRYIASLTYDWNKMNRNENGGILPTGANDSALRDLRLAVRSVNVSLNQAKNNYRYRDLVFRQTYWLIMDKDSNPRLGLSHSLSHTRESNYYSDKSQDFGYYDSIYHFNSNYSADSMNMTSLSNRIEIFTPSELNAISIQAGLQSDAIRYIMMANQGNYFIYTTNNLSLFGGVGFKLLKSFSSKAEARLYFSGYNGGDYQLKWNNTTKLGSSFVLSANALASSRHAYYMQNKFLSNHYIWNNSFDPVNVKNLQLTISKNRKRSGNNAYYYSRTKESFTAELNYFLTDNMIYYNRQGIPEQGAKGQNGLQAKVWFNTGFHQFRIDQNLMWQTLSNNLSSTMQLPSWASRTSLYFQGYAFKKATFVQIGVDANICASYQASYYNPGISSFQLSSSSVGAYPFLDFFINAEIKTARIFVKMEHFNQDMFGEYAFKNYSYTTPYYPAASRRLRVGFNWKFFY